jgi:hypothetical protein
MAETKRIFQLLTALPVALVVVGSFYAWNRQYVSHPDGEILVITTHDPNAPSADTFSSQVYMGAHDAYLGSDPSSNPIEPRKIVIPLDSRSDLEYKLSREISKYKILGIVSAGTSQTDAPLAELCRHLHIPLLITVATNDNLTAHATGESEARSNVQSSADNAEVSADKSERKEAESANRSNADDDHTDSGAADPSHGSDSDVTGTYEERVIFRMLPDNSQQTRAILDKLVPIDKSRKIIILHEDNAYSKFLYDRISARLSHASQAAVFSYLVTGSESITAAAPSLERLQKSIGAVVYLGYSDHAIDLLQAFAAYDVHIPIYLSDGCYSPALRNIVTELGLDDVSLAFPVEPFTEKQTMPGFAAYGYNAYTLLLHLHDVASHSEGLSLREILNTELGKLKAGQIKGPQVPAGAKGIDFPERFSHTGEPEDLPGHATDFKVCNVKSSSCDPTEGKG